MKIIIATTIIAISVSACGNKELQDVQEMVKAKLTDPESAQFRNVKASTEDYICGEVNSKNKFGGYVGFRSFAYDKENKQFIMEDEKGGDALYIKRVCAETNGKRSVALNALLEINQKMCEADEKSSFCNEAEKIRQKIKETENKYPSK